MPTIQAAKMNAGMPAAPPRFNVPSGACDCHVHVFEPDRFPYAPSRRYTPGQASVDDLLALQRALGLSRAVLVQPSVYGADHACLLDALRRLGPRAIGVGVIDETMPASRIYELDSAGVRGTRLNLEVTKQRDPSAAARRLRALADRIPPHWHVQIYTALSVIAALQAEIASLRMAVVIDHFGLARAEGGANQPGFEELLALVRGGKAYVSSRDHTRFPKNRQVTKTLRQSPGRLPGQRPIACFGGAIGRTPAERIATRTKTHRS